jgi:tetratricopeptide (TPR) repeat protein
MMLRAALLMGVVVSFSLSPALGATPLFDVEAAMAQSQATGRPIVAIAGSTGCVYCKKMAAELANDPEAQEPAGKFVVLLLDTDDPVRWPRWNSRYKVDGKGIPAVFVVRANGEQIYGGNGAPGDLPAWLDQRLADAGTVLDDAGLQELTAAARSLSRSWRRGDPADVIAELNPLLDPENFSAPSRQIATIAVELREQAEKKLAEAERQLAGETPPPADAFEAAVTVLSVERDYAELPGFVDVLLPKIEAIKDNPKAASALEPAAQVVEAERLFRDEKREEALAIMTSLAGKPGDDGVADYAKSTLARWERTKPGGSDATVTTDSDAPVAKPTSSSLDDDELAAVQLRLGKRMLERNPDSAPKYFKRAIELAPDSPSAAEARTLLKQSQ